MAILWLVLLSFVALGDDVPVVVSCLHGDGGVGLDDFAWWVDRLPRSEPSDGGAVWVFRPDLIESLGLKGGWCMMNQSRSRLLIDQIGFGGDDGSALALVIEGGDSDRCGGKIVGGGDIWGRSDEDSVVFDGGGGLFWADLYSTCSSGSTVAVATAGGLEYKAGFQPSPGGSAGFWLGSDPLEYEGFVLQMVEDDGIIRESLVGGWGSLWSKTHGGMSLVPFDPGDGVVLLTETHGGGGGGSLLGCDGIRGVPIAVRAASSTSTI